MNKKAAIIIFILFISAFFAKSIYVAQAAVSDIKKEVKQIQQQIEEKKKEIDDLAEEQKSYERSINKLQKEAKTLKNEISLLDAKIAKIRTEIRKNEKEIDYLNLSIKNIQFRILEKERQIKNQKSQLKRTLQLIRKQDKNDYLSVLILNPSLSSLANKIHYLKTLEKNLLYSLRQFKTIKSALEEQRLAKRQNLNKIQTIKAEIETQKSKLVATKQAKSNLLDQTRGAEWKFQSLLAQAIKEERQREKEIQLLEKTAREKLAALEKKKKISELEEEGDIIFSWPVPKEGITCKFHDPDYPYIHIIGQHSGIDLRASQGTPVRAAASGYVARAKDGGMGYSYIMIIHNKKFSTLYGHLSKISVSQGEYIRRGEVIGKSGGLPGTPGAGRFSTGPHLHFEVRANGIPVDPLDYLL